VAEDLRHTAADPLLEAAQRGGDLGLAGRGGGDLGPEAVAALALLDDLLAQAGGKAARGSGEAMISWKPWSISWRSRAIIASTRAALEGK
jgi:hypothetical protein